MKHGRRLTKKQKILLKENHFNPDNWLLERDALSVMVFINRYDRARKIELKKADK